MVIGIVCRDTYLSIFCKRLRLMFVLGWFVVFGRHEVGSLGGAPIAPLMTGCVYAIAVVLAILFALGRLRRQGNSEQDRSSPPADFRETAMTLRLLLVISVLLVLIWVFAEPWLR